jgi:hypothetical protein
MGQRTLFDSLTNAHRAVDYEITFLPQGTSAPVLGEGDLKGTYVTLARTGVGTYTLLIKDPYVGLGACSGSVALGTPAGSWSVCFGTATKSAANLYTLPFTIFNGASAADIAAGAGNIVSLYVRLRNSTVLS